MSTIKTMTEENSIIDIETGKSVTSHIDGDMVAEAQRLENNPEMILRLIDLMFLGDDSKTIPS